MRGWWNSCYELLTLLLLLLYNMTEEEFILSQYNPDEDDNNSNNNSNNNKLSEFSQEDIITKNNEIIRYADKNIIERLKYSDASLKLSEITQAKQAAFQQNAKLLGLEDDNNKQLIPAQINIQIINN